MNMKTFNQTIIEEFRANGGKVAMFAGHPMVILHTIGAKTGREHLVPLVLTINEDNEWLLFGSYAGAQKHPIWVSNLRAKPNITVEYATEHFAARIEELPDEEAREKVGIQAGISEKFAEYVKLAAPRNIPAFRVYRT
jgi:deazaflavin-dependent oxidoreductase (nitroreductase family)